MSADNTNTNFGGMKRKGKNNVLYKLEKKLNRKVIGVGCAAHIVHNAVQTAADVLPVDIQGIIRKVFQYFHQFTVRVEHLKLFCDFVDIEYKTVLGASNTRWLSLQPALNRFVDMYEGLKSYFLSQDKCPHVLYEFFNNRKHFVFFLFLKAQLKMFSDAILRIEREEATGFEVKKEIDVLIMKLNMRQKEFFLTGDVKEELKTLLEEDLITEDLFKKYIGDFYTTAIEYIKEWSSDQFSVFTKMEWVSLNISSFTWEKISGCAEEIKKILPNLQINDEILFDDYTHVKMYADEHKINEWNNSCCKIEERWRELSAHFKKENIACRELVLLVSFSLTLPGSNASVERIFSLMNSLWTDERNRLQLDTVQSILTIKTHYKHVSCSEFYEMISGDQKLLEKIHSSAKYCAISVQDIKEKKQIQAEEPSASTSTSSSN